uniref:Intraflagellar transport protein 46 homolog n=1 Tax=Nothobranchius furzeri TaxID=105023 RepID=A0A8C6M3F6_NOTFU
SASIAFCDLSLIKPPLTVPVSCRCPMERANRRKDAQLVKNQPGDESLEVDGEEVTSLHSPTPRRHPQVTGNQLNHSSDEFKDHHRPQRPTEPGPGPNQDEEEEEDSDEEDTDDDDDDDEPTESLEGAYNPADYAHLPVSTEIKELFQYITRYTPQTVDLEHSLKPFIPDFIPAVGDIDAFLKVCVFRTGFWVLVLASSTLCLSVRTAQSRCCGSIPYPDASGPFPGDLFPSVEMSDICFGSHKHVTHPRSSSLGHRGRILLCRGSSNHDGWKPRGHVRLVFLLKVMESMTGPCISFNVCSVTAGGLSNRQHSWRSK